MKVQGDFPFVFDVYRAICVVLSGHFRVRKYDNSV